MTTVHYTLQEAIELAVSKAFQETDSEVIYQALFGPSYEESMKQAA